MNQMIHIKLTKFTFQVNLKARTHQQMKMKLKKEKQGKIKLAIILNLEKMMKGEAKIILNPINENHRKNKNLKHIKKKNLMICH